MTKVNVSSHIKSIEPYEGGLPIEEVARELNIPEQDIVKLASNENPLGISPLAKKAIERSLIDIERYPDGNGFYLKRAISKKYKLQSSEIILGNGSNDVLELVARTFLSQDDEAIYSEHAFAHQLGLSPLVFKVKRENGFICLRDKRSAFQGPRAAQNQRPRHRIEGPSPRGTPWSRESSWRSRCPCLAFCRIAWQRPG